MDVDRSNNVIGYLTLESKEAVKCSLESRKWRRNKVSLVILEKPGIIRTWLANIHYERVTIHPIGNVDPPIRSLWIDHPESSIHAKLFLWVIQKRINSLRLSMCTLVVNQVQRSSLHCVISKNEVHLFHRMEPLKSSKTSIMKICLLGRQTNLIRDSRCVTCLR